MDDCCNAALAICCLVAIAFSSRLLGIQQCQWSRRNTVVQEAWKQATKRATSTTTTKDPSFPYVPASQRLRCPPLFDPALSCAVLHFFLSSAPVLLFKMRQQDIDSDIQRAQSTPRSSPRETYSPLRGSARPARQACRRRVDLSPNGTGEHMFLAMDYRDDVASLRARMI